jgi:hypothetical protein
MSTCRACGKSITTINAGMSRGIVTLARVWVHRSWWANQSHNAIPGKENR